MADIRRYQYSNEADPDACFNAVHPARADEDLAAYHASVALARPAVAGRLLDKSAPGAEANEPYTLRWVYLHMLEEYARTMVTPTWFASGSTA